eukprot:4030660-Amphidinium_carterae.1
MFFNPGHGRTGPAQPWLLLWDLSLVYCAHVTLSVATRQRIKDAFPWMCVCYIAGSATACSQPLDKAISKSFIQGFKQCCDR